MDVLMHVVVAASLAPFLSAPTPTTIFSPDDDEDENLLSEVSAVN